MDDTIGGAEPVISTYEISVQCRNCRHVPLTDAGDALHQKNKKFPIPKGNTIKKFLQEMMCENCDCTGYMGLL
ncbi:hypothetical protein LCGC14_0356180 [marine sediment metagenome]|uniref:Uncharacterized protein n=1 Tax=marine sediment metagenome TaxID=412755 RepID=A0A0F9VWP8_9ZZZZ